MFDKWLGIPAHYYLRITGLLILTIGICLHNTLMSIGAIWVIANWLIEAKFKSYWKNFKQSPEIWMLLVLLTLSILSLLWSDNLNYGLKDLSRKLPFFVIPIAITTGKTIDKKVLHFLLYVLIGITCLTSFINFYRFNYILNGAVDIREMSYFISHIRFSVITAIALFTSIYFLINRKTPTVLWIITSIWLMFYLLKSQALNGYILFGLLSFITILYLIWLFKDTRLKISLGLLTALGTVVLIWMVSVEISDYKGKIAVDSDTLVTETVNGRAYINDVNSEIRENGRLVWIYVQPEEVEKEWNKRSEIDYKSVDRKGQPMFGTILRYMTSKGLRKDSVGVWQLTEDEIHKIENGVTSIASNSGAKSKLHEFMYQWYTYNAGGDPDGHSILQRLEHLKAACWLISKNWLIGVGIGDVPVAFHQAYIEINSQLSKENRHRSHNQFLTIWISHGILGFLALLGMLIIPLFKSKINYFSIVIFIALFVSCLFQDLLETQAGVTLFGLFYVLAFHNQISSSLSSSRSTSSS